MGFLNALLNKPNKTKNIVPLTRQQPSNTGGPASLGQPVPVANIYAPPSNLSSDATLNNASVGAWPELINSSYKFFSPGGWVVSKLKEVSTVKTPANYGSVTSNTGFGFRFRAYDGIANSGIDIPNSKRPTYQNLIPIIWGLRVPNPNTPSSYTSEKGPIPVQTHSTVWQGTGTASVTKNGVTLL
jgi:hypothetical protein